MLLDVKVNRNTFYQSLRSNLINLAFVVLTDSEKQEIDGEWTKNDRKKNNIELSSALPLSPALNKIGISVCIIIICERGACIHINSSRNFATDASNFDTKFQWILRFRQYWNDSCSLEALLLPLAHIECTVHWFFVCDYWCRKSLNFICLHRFQFKSDIETISHLNIWWQNDEQIFEQPKCSTDVWKMFMNTIETMWIVDWIRETYADIHSMKYAVEREIIELKKKKVVDMPDWCIFIGLVFHWILSFIR